MASPSSTPDAPVGSRSVPDVPYAGVEYSQATAWTAWAFLGAIMLMMVGAVHAGLGLVALFNPEFLAATRADLLLPVGLTALAWAHIVIGVIAVVTGVQLIRGRRWARVMAILLAGVSALVNFAFIDVYPLWSITIIVLAGLVIYSVAAHGGELADAYSGS
jgi:hypothetical protein